MIDRRLACRTLLLAAALPDAAAFGQRAMGIDVADWQGSNINWATVARPVAQGGAGIQFAFIRSSRGGTTGTYNENTRVGTLSERYDDLYFVQNMNRAKANGILPGPYHFARPDIATNTGADEADHFIQTAGAYMRPGYIRPVLDLEAGANRSKTDLTNWALAFSDRLLAVKGVRPIVYINSSYATDEVDSRINTHDLWIARWVDPTQVDIQTVLDPPAASQQYANVYGVWNPTYPTMPAVRPWDFWQYKSTGPIAGISATNVDHDIANGDVNFVKEFLIPAVWNVDADGDWSASANWNTGAALPSALDRTVVNRAAGAYTVTLSGGAHAVRSLQMNEAFTLTGGSLAVEQYANLNGDTTVDGPATLSAASIVNNGGFAQSAGTVTTGPITGNGSIALTGGTLRATTVKHNQLAISGGTLELQGSGTSVVKLLTVNGTGRLELSAAKLIVDYATASPIGTVRAALRDGFNAGDWLGDGIALPAGSSDTLAIGYVRSTDLFSDFTTATFGGERVDATALLITRVLKGDTNLSGTVDFDDLLALAQHYEGTGYWLDGDVTYDGLVDFDDLLAVSQNYGNALLAGDAVAVGDHAGFAADWALAQALVPEPTTVASLSLLAFARRRRVP